MQATSMASLLLSLLFLSFSLSLSSSIEYQTLKLTSLPNAPSLDSNLLWPDSSESEISSGSGQPDSLSLQLHHVDALSANATAAELFSLRLRRDTSRVQSLAAMSRRRNGTHHGGGGGIGFSGSVVSGLNQGSGEYFTRIGVGTPARYLYMVLDTGSDVVWIQCQPCKKCYTQVDPIFDPKRSRSYAGIPCASPLCRRLDQSGCNRRAGKCAYQVSYGDGSFTVGEFATETMTFRGTRVPNVALGCGHDNQGLFIGAAGLLGLGRGRLSFPTQTGRRFGSKFSYCLVDRTASSKPSSVIFGASAAPRATIFTPLLSNPKLDTFYYVELVGISVGGHRIAGISKNSFKFDRTGNGGVIIDSGTSVTRLAEPAYIALRDAFRVGATGLKSAPEFSLFDTCYDLSGKTEVKVPTVVLHFAGADVALPANNYLIPVDESARFCFAFASTMSGLSIIGNIQQQGFRVVFDVSGRRVGFAPRGCA